MRQMTCISCGQSIPAERAEFLAEHGKACVCVHCSAEKAKVCFLDYSHKTAPSLVVVGTNAEAIRLASNAYKRRR
jgi:hypothetical protein